MELFEAKPKPRESSLWITIPSKIVKLEHISPGKPLKVLIFGTETENLNRAFGTLKLKKSTQKLMDEIAL